MSGAFRHVSDHLSQRRLMVVSMGPSYGHQPLLGVRMFQKGMRRFDASALNGDFQGIVRFVVISTDAVLSSDIFGEEQFDNISESILTCRDQRRLSPRENRVKLSHVSLASVQQEFDGWPVTVLNGSVKWQLTQMIRD
jgi:hypothetical protein